MGILGDAMGLVGSVFGGGGGSAPIGSDEIANRQNIGIVPDSNVLGQLMIFASGPEQNGGNGIGQLSRASTPVNRPQVSNVSQSFFNPTMILVGLGVLAILWYERKRK